MSSSDQEAPLLTGGTILKDRWEILRKIGRGGFGEIYKAKDHDSGERCAVKVESAISSKQVLKMEVVVLKKLQSCSPHICTLLGCGRTDKINYIVMTLLGPNISELRKQQPNQRFSLSTTLRVAVQVIAAVRAMHNCGFLHRDIKPSNFAIGASSVTKHTCYMLDFGLARQYVTSTGELRPPRPVAGFRGTVRYASINAHQSKDLGRHDDLWSVFYLIVELVNGELPWKKIREKEKAGKYKLGYDHKRLLKHLPAEFYDFLDHLKSLDYFQEPDYVMLSTLIQNTIRYLGIKRSDPFDWEQDPSLRSLTTISAGSAPALQTNQTSVGKEDKEERGDSKTISTEECLGLNPVIKKDDNVVKKEMVSSEEKGRVRSGTADHIIVQTKKNRRLELIQQRRSLPPSPLLQATHLANHNDSGLHQTSSLDRFFDMKPGEGEGGSPSNSCRSSPRLRDQRRIDTHREPGEKSTGNYPKEQPRHSKSLPHRGREGERGGREREKNTGSIAKLSSGEFKHKAESPADDNKKEKIEAPLNEKEHVLNYATKRELGKLEGDSVERITTAHQGLDKVTPESNSKPQLAYSNEESDWVKRQMIHEEERENSVPSESSGRLIRHRLFADSMHNGSKEGEVECISIEMLARVNLTNEAHSPGPPPLEGHKPQKMWGEDATKPMSLNPCNTLQSPERTRPSERAPFLPHPPDHPPPKHYTLLTARQRRFKKPAKS